MPWLWSLQSLSAFDFDCEVLPLDTWRLESQVGEFEKGNCSSLEECQLHVGLAGGYFGGKSHLSPVGDRGVRNVNVDRVVVSGNLSMVQIDPKFVSKSPDTGVTYDERG